MRLGGIFGAQARISLLNEASDLPESQGIHQSGRADGAGNSHTNTPQQGFRQATNQRPGGHAGKEADPSEKAEKDQGEQGRETVRILGDAKVAPKSQPSAPDAPEQGP